MQKSLAGGDWNGFLHRICEGTEQIHGIAERRNSDEIQEKIDQGYTITVGCFDFDMYDKNKKLYAEDVGGHYMTITGVTDDGYIEVSSWGEKYYIKSDDPGIDDYQIVKFE